MDQRRFKLTTRMLVNMVLLCYMIPISLHPYKALVKHLRVKFHRFSPEVGDLQRSSEVLEPSLESQSAEGAAEVGIKHSGMSPTAGKSL